MTERTEAIWNRCLASGCGLLLVAMLPLLLSRVLVAAGVQWSRVNDGDRLNALIGLGVGGIGLAMTGIGIVIAVLAYRLTAQGTVLAQKQDAYFEEQRALRASLRITPPRHWSRTPGVYELWLTNAGRRPSRGSWYLGVPTVAGGLIITAAEGFREVPAHQNADYSNPYDEPHVSCFNDDYVLKKFDILDEVAAGDSRLCATVEAVAVHDDYPVYSRTLLWFTQSADGRFPERGMTKMLLAHSAEHWLKYPKPEHVAQINEALGAAESTQG